MNPKKQSQEAWEWATLNKRNVLSMQEEMERQRAQLVQFSRKLAESQRAIQALQEEVRQLRTEVILLTTNRGTGPTT